MLEYFLQYKSWFYWFSWFVMSGGPRKLWNGIHMTLTFRTIYLSIYSINQVLKITQSHSPCLFRRKPSPFLSTHTSERDLYCQTHINNWWHCYWTEGVLFLCHSYSIFSSISICWVVPMVLQPLATTRTFREAFCSQKWRHSSHQVIFPISKCMLKMFLKFRDCIFSILFVPPKNIKINLGPPEIQNMFFGNKLVCKWG